MPSASSNAKKSDSVNISNLVANLVKGIKVPENKTEQKDQKDRASSIKIFSSLEQPSRLDALRSISPKLAEIYEANPSNYGIFILSRNFCIVLKFNI